MTAQQSVAPGVADVPPWTTAALLGGVLGPTAFIGAWVLAGTRTDGYDVVSTTISHLAAQGAPSRTLMTAGFVAFGIGLPAFATALGRAVGSRAVTVSAATAGVATLGVALTPLSQEGGLPIDRLHAVAALTGYVAMALTPALAGRAVRSGRVSRASYAVAVVSALGLVGSLVLPGIAGLGQRVGLTVVDAWFVVAALLLLRRRRLISLP